MLLADTLLFSINTFFKLHNCCCWRRSKMNWNSGVSWIKIEFLHQQRPRCETGEKLLSNGVKDFCSYLCFHKFLLLIPNTCGNAEVLTLMKRSNFFLLSPFEMCITIAQCCCYYCNLLSQRCINHKFLYIKRTFARESEKWVKSSLKTTKLDLVQHCHSRKLFDDHHFCALHVSCYGFSTLHRLVSWFANLFWYLKASVS